MFLHLLDYILYTITSNSTLIIDLYVRIYILNTSIQWYKHYTVNAHTYIYHCKGISKNQVGSIIYPVGYEYVCRNSIPQTCVRIYTYVNNVYILYSAVYDMCTSELDIYLFPLLAVTSNFIKWYTLNIYTVHGNTSHVYVRMSLYYMYSLYTYVRIYLSLTTADLQTFLQECYTLTTDLLAAEYKTVEVTHFVREHS